MASWNNLALIICLAAAVCLGGCSQGDDTWQAQDEHAAPPAGLENPSQDTPQPPAHSVNPMDYLGTVVKQPRLVEQRMELVVIKQNIQAFWAEKGRFPKSLDELNSVYKLPSAPEGMRYEYNPETGDITIATGDENETR